MTEVEEVAEKLVAGYVKHRDACYKENRMAGRLEDYIIRQLSKDESYNYISEVQAAAKKLPHA